MERAHDSQASRVPEERETPSDFVDERIRKDGHRGAGRYHHSINQASVLAAAITAIRLYPAGWRTRYGDEFEVILAERPLGPFDVADILLGAFDAQLRLRGAAGTAQERGLSMSLRTGGLAAILGGAVFALSIAWASGASEISIPSFQGSC
jgi:hypothetical protein